jgi:hypothetical protein
MRGRGIEGDRRVPCIISSGLSSQVVPSFLTS